MATSPKQTAATLSHDTRSESVTLCVPVLMRVQKLRRLLESLPPAVDEVIVADNGHTNQRQSVTNPEQYDADITVRALPHDCGIGRCRQQAAAAASNDYLLVADNDMILPDSIQPLLDILRADPDLGAVSGTLHEDGHLRAGVCNFREESIWGRDLLVQTHDEDTTVETVGGHPLARHDKLPNAMVVRRACVEDYSWDGQLKDKEHLDWFLGHYHETDWEMGVCPSVVFRHEHGENEQYQQQYRHGNTERQQQYHDMVCEKYGYDDIVWGDTRWFGTERRPLVERLYNAVEGELPTSLSYPAKQAAKAVIGR
ncbi:glycosyltransferase [Haloarcula argentinensis]|uniref:Glycosyltransferase n=1 Tax=Haloarcula argentinensis TaxID=43776 RepID=A0A847UP41_HALAR|nr:glycosyltransferase [Haloarcula argentinensis]NLV14366.1 glycosyltransferase [Haloarcula argentinensis]